MRVVAAADGVVLDAVRGGDIAIATSVAPDFVGRLYQTGAVLVVDGTALSRCLPIADRHRFSVKGADL